MFSLQLTDIINGIRHRFNAKASPCEYILCELVYHIKSRSYVRFVVKFLFYMVTLPRYEIESQDESSDGCFVYSKKRQDYLSLIKSYKKSLGSDPDSCNSVYCGGYSVLGGRPVRQAWWRLASALKTADSLYRCMKEPRWPVAIRILHFFARYVEMVGAKVAGDFLESEDMKVPHLFCFNSSFRNEALICHSANSKGLMTYGFQHGMYFNYANKQPIDAINFVSPVAKETILWGQYSYNQIGRYVRAAGSTPIIKGHPSFPFIERPFCNDYTETIRTKIIALLPRDIYVKEVLQLLKILLQCRDYTIEIKPHPSLMRTRCWPIIVSISNMLGWEINTGLLSEIFLKRENIEGAVCVGFNSTALFEAVAFGMKTLQYVTGNDEFLSTNLGEFRTHQELQTHLNNVNVGSLVDEGFFFRSPSKYINVGE